MRLRVHTVVVASTVLLGIAACSNTKVPPTSKAAEYVKVLNSHKADLVFGSNDYDRLYKLALDMVDFENTMTSLQHQRDAFAQVCSETFDDLESLNEPDPAIKSLVVKTKQVYEKCSLIGSERDGAKVNDAIVAEEKILSKWETYGLKK